eukprot:COSAG05_NODE_117_length_17936_cov_137.220945_11_plen_876_part_00
MLTIAAGLQSVYSRRVRKLPLRRPSSQSQMAFYMYSAKAASSVPWPPLPRRMVIAALISLSALSSAGAEQWFRGSPWPGNVAPRAVPLDCSGAGVAQEIATATELLQNRAAAVAACADDGGGYSEPGAEEDVSGSGVACPEEEAMWCQAKGYLTSLTEGLYQGLQEELACMSNAVLAAQNAAAVFDDEEDDVEAYCSGPCVEDWWPDAACSTCDNYYTAKRILALVPPDANYTAAVCPIGCWRSAPGVCSACPDVYEECGEAGGCDPRSDLQRFDAATVYLGWARDTGTDEEVDGELLEEATAQVTTDASGPRPLENVTTPPTNYTRDELVCKCASGLQGRRCNSKSSSPSMFGILFLCYCVSALLDALLKDPVSPESWRFPGYSIEQIPGSVPCDLDTASLVFQFLQLGSAAFKVTIPWTFDFVLPAILRLPAMNLPEVLPEYDIDPPGFGAQILFLSVLMTLMAVAAEKGGEGRWADCANALGPLIMVPAARIYGGVFGGCTFYEFKDNTFDADPTLSCWSSFWWWIYAIMSLFGFAGLVLTVKNVSDQEGNLSNGPSHPASVKYAKVFSFAKVFTTVIDTTFGRWHPRLSSALYIGTDLYMIYFVVDRKPFVHAYLSRLTIYANIQTMIGYVSAVVALEVDNPQSTISENTYTWMSFLALGAYLGNEIYLFQSDLPVVGKFHQAWEFGRVYILDEETNLPAFEDKCNAKGEEVRLIESTRENQLKAVVSSLRGKEAIWSDMWALMEAENPSIQAKYDKDIAAYNERKKAMQAEGTWDDENEEPEPSLDLWTRAKCNYEWAYMTRINALGGTQKTEAWEEKFGRKSDGGEAGESEEGTCTSEDNVAQTDSTSQGDGADEATENPVADNSSGKD